MSDAQLRKRRTTSDGTVEKIQPKKQAAAKPSAHDVNNLRSIITTLFFCLLLCSLLVASLLLLGNRKVYDGTYWKASEILPGMYLGGFKDVLNLDELKKRNITHILSIAIGIEPVFPDEFEHMVIRAFDHKQQDLLSYMPIANKFIDKAMDEGTLLVNCMAGVSRSSTIVTSYIMYKKQWPLYEAFEHVKLRRRRVKPNKAFWHQLEIVNHFNFNYSHPDLLRYTPNWPVKASVYHYDRYSSYGKKIAGPEHIEVAWTTRIWELMIHYYVNFYNMYLRFYFKKRN